MALRAPNARQCRENGGLFLHRFPYGSKTPRYNTFSVVRIVRRGERLPTYPTARSVCGAYFHLPSAWVKALGGAHGSIVTALVSVRS
jgi:hypothetical protein